MGKLIRTQVPLTSFEQKSGESYYRTKLRESALRGEVCPMCLGLGVLRRDRPLGHPEFGTLVPCDTCRQNQIPNYLRRMSGLTGSNLDASFEGWFDAPDRKPQLEAAMAMVKAQRGWLTLWGAYGTSKTYLLASMVNRLIERSRPAVYTTAAAMLDKVVRALEGNFELLLEQWRSIHCLALDEIDVYQPTEFREVQLRNILNHRYENKSMTLFATNREPGGVDWPPSLGWLASRMNEFNVVKAGGPNVRPLLKETSDEAETADRPHTRTPKGEGL